MAYAVLGARPNSHPFQERKVTLKEPVKIGRAVAKCKSAPNNLIFDCKVLSRSHAVIWYENGKFFIQDTKSSNGTYVNNNQVGRGGDDSETIEIRSGDTLQFGVDVTENSKKVTHGCIIAMVTLVHPDGTEAYGEPEKPTGRILPFVAADRNLRSQELWQLSRYLQDAMNREQLLEQKLATMQRMIANSSSSSEETFQAFVKEDELLSRLDILENELDIITKEMSEEDCRRLLIGFQEEKETYEVKAKETIQRLIEEKSETLQKLADAQRTLSYSEDECTHFKSLYEKSEDDIKDLMDRNDQFTNEVQENRENIDALNESIKTMEEKMIDERRKLKLDVEEAEKRASTLAVHVESLQAECDFTKEQLAAMKEKLDKRPPDVTGISEEKTSELGSELSLPSSEQKLKELQENLLQIKKSVQGIIRDSDEEDGFMESNISTSLGEDGEVTVPTTLESCTDFAKEINDELLVASRHVEKWKKSEENDLVDQLNSAQTEMLLVQTQIQQLNENLAIEQATSQKYKELATEFEVRLGREEGRRNQLMASFEAMNNRLKELQMRLHTQEDASMVEETDLAQNQENKAFDKSAEEMDSLEDLQVAQSDESLHTEQTTNAEGKEVETLLHDISSDPRKELDKSNFFEEFKITKTQKNQLLYLLVALVVLIVAIGAAWMLDVFQVSTGRSPMFDWNTWRELYEQLF